MIDKKELDRLLNSIRQTKQYQKWRKEVLETKGDFCNKCGITGALQVHHKKKLVKIVLEKNIKTLSDALKEKKIWDVNNGQVLCSNCHIESHISKTEVRKW